MGCQRFTLDRQRISKLVRLFERKTKLLWVDETLLSPNPQPKEKPKPVEEAKETPLSTNPQSYEQGRKLLTPQECFSCPIYRPQCGHCLGAEMKDGRRYVVCDYQRPR